MVPAFHVGTDSSTAAPVLDPVPAYVPVKASEDDPSVWEPCAHMKAPSFGAIQLWSLQPYGQ